MICTSLTICEIKHPFMHPLVFSISAQAAGDTAGTGSAKETENIGKVHSGEIPFSEEPFMPFPVPQKNRGRIVQETVPAFTLAGSTLAGSTPSTHATMPRPTVRPSHWCIHPSITHALT